MAEEESYVGGGNRRPIQMVKVKPGGWTKARRATFLKLLAETCNVSMAARRCGATGSPYVLRRRDPAFALLWDDALAIGYDRLETLLLQRALEGVNDIDVGKLAEESEHEAAVANASGGTAGGGGAAERGLFPNLANQKLGRGDVQLALTLLNRRRDIETRSNHGRKIMTPDEVDALLLKKLDALARKLARPRD